MTAEPRTFVDVDAAPSLNRDRSPAFAAMNAALKDRAERMVPSR